ncbi:MAG: TIGR03032 family protein [Pirellulaceae bacterium]|nr:TIGR03032 family protein [Pirellulaceae bacterium]
MTQSPDDTVSEPTLREVRYEYTPRLPEILTHLRASILVTTYQAGKLLVLGAHENKLTISFLDYDQPMGLEVSPELIAIGTRRQMHFLVPAHETQGPDSEHDGCFVPRSSYYTGSIHGHDLGWGNEGLWIVNTLFSCLSTLHEDYSFVPHWRPPFISQLIDQDRCHLNGMALEAGRPKYVTAMSETDSPAGWRPNKATSGVVMEVPSGEVVCRGLSMPHSPRLHAGRLWALNSGYGSLGWIEPNSGQYHQVEALPGYTRGLSFCGQFAFVGLSKIRETSVFGGVPIAEHRHELRCGVGVIDLTTGRTVAVFQFHSGVSEIFAVEVLQGFKNPLIAGAAVDRHEREVWIVPAENMPRPKPASRLPIFAGETAAAPPAMVSGNLGSASTSSLSSNAAATQLSLAEAIAIARTFHARGQLEQAADSYEAAIALSKASAPLLVDLGNLRQDQGNQPAALVCYERALQADRFCVAALQNLGYLLFNMGEAEKAHDVYERLIEQDPSPLNRLLASSVLPVVYDSQADIDYWRNRQMRILQELNATGGQADATSTLVPTVFFAAYQGLSDRPLMEMRARAIKGRDFTQAIPRGPRPDGRRRVAFMSAYFRDHTIGRLNIQRLEQLSRQNLHLTIIYTGGARDEMVDRFERAADQFVQLPRDLPTAIDTLAKLDLDLLVHADVGMDALTQTLAYSRFAPVQATTWGHPDTTGSQTIDYFLSSEALERPDGDHDYTERLVRLSRLGIDYQRPVLAANAKSRSELGLPVDRRLYACPQTLFKFHPDFDEVLAGILEQDPQGELILLEGRLPEWTHRLRRRFRRTLPDQGSRVRFLPTLARGDFLSLLATVDVLLDPMHFGGGNSSLEAIAVGTPLVTLEGQFLRSRITSAIYKQIAYTELIAESPSSYVRLAVRLANDLSYRSMVQQQLRLATSGLFDDHTAAGELEQCLLGMLK